MQISYDLCILLSKYLVLVILVSVGLLMVFTCFLVLSLYFGLGLQWLVFMCFIVPLTLGVKYCIGGFSVVVREFYLSPSHLIYGLQRVLRVLAK